MMEIFLFLLGLFLFSLLIILHEFGHFLVAKRNGVDVKEFGLGFPPAIVSKEMGKGILKSKYSLNFFPIGGFVRLEGENDEAKGSRSYGSKSLYVKAKIILAGVFVNFLIATLLFTILALIGIPKLLPAEPLLTDEQFSLPSDTQILEDKTLISYIDEDSPASQAGLEIGDEVIILTDLRDNQTYSVESSERLNDLTKELAGHKVLLGVIRDQQNLSHEITLQTLQEAEETQTGRLGVGTYDLIIQRNTWSAPITGVALTVQYTKVTLEGLWQILGSLVQGDTQTAGDSVTGPIGLFFILQSGAEQGLSFILMIIALLSLSLAILNALPIPALDGGRLMLTLLFRKVLRRPLIKKTENRIIGASMIGLLMLMVLVTISDIIRFFFS